MSDERGKIYLFPRIVASPSMAPEPSVLGVPRAAVLPELRQVVALTKNPTRYDTAQFGGLWLEWTFVDSLIETIDHLLHRG
ncbi:MAG: hypothetical protein LBV29_03705 [Azoarcus sp.]|nr:hypothetical protein [Azoarcus sp.]